MDILQYFQLNEQPFRIGPDPRFLYLSDQVKEAIAKCEYMARERIGPIYIYGPIGACSGCPESIARLLRNAPCLRSRSILLTLEILGTFRHVGDHLPWLVAFYPAIRVGALAPPGILVNRGWSASPVGVTFTPLGLATLRGRCRRESYRE